MTIFFTHVFTERFNLHEKQLMHLKKSLSKYWVTKSIFSPAVSQICSPKTCFLPVHFDLELTSFLEICFAQCIKQHLRYEMHVLMKKTGMYSFGIILNLNEKSVL